LKRFEELGGGTGPSALTPKDASDSFFQSGGGRLYEGPADFIFGEAGLAGEGEGRASGEDPGEGIGEAARSPGQARQALEGRTDSGAERSEYGGERLAQRGQKFDFGPALFGRKLREADGEGSFGEFGRRGPTRSGGEEYRVAVILQQGLRLEAGRFAEGCAETGRESTKGIREIGWEGGNMVEGEDPILTRDGEEVAEIEGNRR
jgi:hypothetical protein